MVIHSTSPKVEWMLCEAFSEWCCQLSSSIRTAAPNSAMVAGSRCSSRASTKPIITSVSTASACLSSTQSLIASTGLMAMTAASRLRGGAQVLAPQDVDHHHLHHQDDDDDRRQVIEEVVEGEADLRADDDVGRVADQRGGAADVGGHDLGEQVRVGRHLQRLRHRDGDRHHQEHGGDVVEQRRQHRGRELQQQQDAAGMRLGRARGPHRHELEHAGAARDRHQDHHAGEQAERVPVDALDGLFLVQHADDDHDAGAGQRDDGAVDLLRHDDGVGDGQDAGGDPHRAEAEIDVRRRSCAVMACALPPRTRAAVGGFAVVQILVAAGNLSMAGVVSTCRAAT